MANAYQQMIDSYSAQRKAQEDFLKQQQANQAKQLQNQVNKTISQLETAKKQYGQTYQDNARQAYIQKMQAQRDLPQQLAAQGVSGGLSESGNIALNTAYGNQLSGYKRDYNDQLSAADQNIYNARQDYNSALADLNNTYLGKLAENNNYYNQLIAQQKAAQLQAEEAARQAAGSSSGSSGSSGSAYANRAQSLFDKDLESGGRTSYDYLKNLLSIGYIDEDSFSNIAAQIGLTDSMIRKYMTSDDVAATARAAAYYARPANRVGAVAGGIASLFR